MFSQHVSSPLVVELVDEVEVVEVEVVQVASDSEVDEPTLLNISLATVRWKAQVSSAVGIIWSGGRRKP